MNNRDRRNAASQMCLMVPWLSKKDDNPKPPHPSIPTHTTTWQPVRQMLESVGRRMVAVVG